MSIRKLLVLVPLLMFVLGGCAGAGGSGDNGGGDSTPRVRGRHQLATSGPADYYVASTTNNQPIDVNAETPDATFLAFGSGTNFQDLTVGQYEVVFTQAGTKTVIARQIFDVALGDDVTAILQSDGSGGSEVALVVL